MYAILDENSSETTKKKGVNASIEFQEYYDTLFQEKIISFFHLLFSLFLALIISIFYCLNYTLLLLHLIATCLVPHFSLSSIIFTISDSNYQHLLMP